MSYISAPNAPDGQRWFIEIGPLGEHVSLYHLGPAPAGWPAGRSRCGFLQSEIAIGRHQTALTVSANERDICPLCLEDLRAELRG